MRVFGEHEENTLAQLRDVAARAEHAALMADGHLGYIMPIGGVAAYRDEVSVVGVGFDIACGNAAIRTDLLLDDCAGNPFATAAVEPLRVHCRRFWYFYRHRLQLSDAIAAHSTMIRLVARRDHKGAQKASDGLIAVIERLVAGMG